MRQQIIFGMGILVFYTKIRVSLLGIIFILVFQACSSPQPKRPDKIVPVQAGPAPKPDTLTRRPDSFRSDTLLVTKRCAVYYQPDSTLMAKRMKAVGESDFRIGMDDYLYYMNESIGFLEKQGLPVIDAEGYKYLLFRSADKRGELVRLDTLDELWGIYFFDPKKKPLQADLIEIDTTYAAYFH